MGHAFTLAGIMVVVVVLGAVVRKIGPDVAGAVAVYGAEPECRAFWEASCAGVCVRTGRAAWNSLSAIFTGWLSHLEETCYTNAAASRETTVPAIDA